MGDGVAVGVAVGDGTGVGVSVGTGCVSSGATVSVGICVGMAVGTGVAAAGGSTEGAPVGMFGSSSHATTNNANAREATRDDAAALWVPEIMAR